ncbi:hypothetical protein [Jeotgalibacillus marinus]|uniref:TetR/AcrR family transcriptional regulator n=1 Tax=Jeotgalibacillus marinus TaxID=86667 RepID=A0ABV3Q568_9BACL
MWVMKMFFLSRDKKSNEGRNVSRDIQNKKEIAKEEVLLMLDYISNDYTYESVIKSLTSSVERKKFIYHTYKLYREELLLSVIYQRELITQLKLILHRLLKWESFKDVQELENTIKTVKNNIGNQVDTYLDKYHDEYFEKYLTTEQGIKGLEKKYLERATFVSFLSDVCVYVYTNDWHSNEGLSGKWLVDEIIRAIEKKVDQLLYFHDF